MSNIITNLQCEFGKEPPLTVTWGKVHIYLGMTIDFSNPVKVTFTMINYIE